MLRLCSSLNQLFSKAFSAMLSMVSSTGTLVKSGDISNDTKRSWFIDFHLMELVSENEHDVDGVVIYRQWFQLLVQPLCKLAVVRSRG